MARKQASQNGEAATDSQQMLALRPFLTGRKGDEKEITDFRSKVEEDQRTLKETLQQRLREVELENARYRDDIAGMISNALLTPFSNGSDTDKTNGTMAGTNIAQCLAYAPANEIIDASRTLVTEYNSMEKLIYDTCTKENQSIGEVWQKDVDKLEDLLYMGHRIAMRSVRKVLGLPSEHADKDRDYEDDMEAVDNVPDFSVDNGLHRTLQYAERGVKRTVKGLPREM
ncbi:hypothetical protein CC78DRAFT_582287 [Lojkania enalia]|uniref:Uncharacterized protein n=1 Tax=Lojkania enalia TaxID=147567 RepID=A0A9P4K6H5_9PLEO|nr:hypothetical protein CC78DRAFT_582287 [Didymosphaeria enalia]